MPGRAKGSARLGCRLMIFLLTGDAAGRRERALPILDTLAEIRPIEGRGPWIVSYAAGDVSEAFASCAEDLDAIDPRWLEVLDFVALARR